jgi:hypothetical protein
MYDTTSLRQSARTMKVDFADIRAQEAGRVVLADSRADSVESLDPGCHTAKTAFATVYHSVRSARESRTLS